MQLSQIKDAASGAAHAVASRVQTNWKNMSTPAKVATVGSSVVLTGAAIAAFATHSLLVSAIAGLSAKIVFAVAGSAAGLGMIVPGAVLLRKPSEAKKEEIVMQQAPAEEAVGPSLEESAVETATVVEKPVVEGPSRLKKALAVSAFAIGTMALAYYRMGVEGRASLRDNFKQTRDQIAFAGNFSVELAKAFKEDVKSGKVRAFVMDMLGSLKNPVHHDHPHLRF